MPKKVNVQNSILSKKQKSEKYKYAEFHFIKNQKVKNTNMQNSILLKHERAIS